jgi:hypothetical protein
MIKKDLTHMRLKFIIHAVGGSDRNPKKTYLVSLKKVIKYFYKTPSQTMRLAWRWCNLKTRIFNGS